ncbi:MAG: DUF4988 domain-containing protein [Prevotellaceae bacterium]|jgi:hypothetical protein|nr:DUF4988 domain-containing protein [Prevotellaceae bacterium]
MRVTGERGSDGAAGQNGSSPQMRINSSNIWEVSYDGGGVWTSLGVPATGVGGQDGQNYVRLFGSSSGTVQNVHLVSGRDYVGGISGNGGASNCHNTGSVSGSNRYTGGICGSGSAGSCYNTGSISGAHYTSGICGISTAAVSTCYNAGFTFGNGNYIGGICGSSKSWSITACCNTANISGGDHYIGGISGNSTSSISACYSIGAVSGNGRLHRRYLRKD